MKTNVWLVTLCVLWVGIVGPESWVWSKSLPARDGDNNNVGFHVSSCTKQTYSAFLKDLRARLSGGTEIRNIPLLRAPSGSHQLLLVPLYDMDEHKITIVINLVNVYLIAYEAKGTYFLLKDTDANPGLYGNNPHTFTFEGGYTQLQRAARSGRELIPLGTTELGISISILFKWEIVKGEALAARALTVLIEMVCEAARFRLIENRVLERIDSHISSRPGPDIISAENNWGSLSQQIQQSNAQGVFVKPVQIQDAANKIITITNTEEAKEKVGIAVLLLYVRRSPQEDLNDSYCENPDQPTVICTMD